MIVDKSLPPAQWEALWASYLEATHSHDRYRLRALVNWWLPVPWTLGGWLGREGGWLSRESAEDLLTAARAAEFDALRERYPEVAPFVESMYRELAANAHKGDQSGWRTMTLREAWSEIAWHEAKLAMAVRDLALYEHPVDRAGAAAAIREHAADIANGCMMLVDILNQLEGDPT